MTRAAARQLPLRGLPAALVDPKTASAEKVAGAVRLVPKDAQRLVIGKALVGYWNDVPVRGRWRLGNQRKAEVERLIGLRHSGACDTDDGEVYFIVVANAIAIGTMVANISRKDPASHARARLMAWAKRWTPRISLDDIASIIDRAIKEPRWWRADSAAKLLALRMAERSAISATTIGATDCNREQRAALRQQRRKERQRTQVSDKRRASGTKTRDEYEAASIAAQARRDGVARSTIYRRRRQCATCLSPSIIDPSLLMLGDTHVASTAPEARSSGLNFVAPPSVAAQGKTERSLASASEPLFGASSRPRPDHSEAVQQ
jgi:hypothetical protein